MPELKLGKKGQLKSVLFDNRRRENAIIIYLDKNNEMHMTYRIDHKQLPQFVLTLNDIAKNLSEKFTANWRMGVLEEKDVKKEGKDDSQRYVG